jgi:hypothetical protein
MLYSIHYTVKAMCGTNPSITLTSLCPSSYTPAAKAVWVPVVSTVDASHPVHTTSKAHFPKTVTPFIPKELLE